MRIARRIQQRVEKSRRRHRVGRQLAVVEKFCQRGLGFRALHAVDRIGVITGDHQKPLDAGEPRLRIVVVGFFGEVHHRAFRRLRRPRRGKMRLLADRTTARIGDLETAVANAEIGIAPLRQRRGAVNRRRARIHIDHVGIERAVEHLPALAGLDAEPAAGRDIGALFQAVGGFHLVAGAVAQRQLGEPLWPSVLQVRAAAAGARISDASACRRRGRSKVRAARRAAPCRP